jgi:hypothetical protein
MTVIINNHFHKFIAVYFKKNWVKTGLIYSEGIYYIHKMFIIFLSLIIYIHEVVMVNKQLFCEGGVTVIER